MDGRISRKVAVFVIRLMNNHWELLLINHPNTDYQIPAGTIKKNELPEVAALRELTEETGLEDTVVISNLGSITREYEHKARLIKKAKIYSRPAKIASKFGKLRRGLKVKIIEERDKFVQIRYKERDNQHPERPVMLHIKGWIKKSRMAKKEIRHFYLVKANDDQTQPWTVIADHHRFTLEWHNLSDILNGNIELVDSVAKWLDTYKEKIMKEIE